MPQTILKFYRGDDAYQVDRQRMERSGYTVEKEGYDDASSMLRIEWRRPDSILTLADRMAMNAVAAA